MIRAEDARSGRGIDGVRAILALRLAIGTLQGLAAWWLTRHAEWPGANPGLYATLALATAYLPLILLAGLGHMRARTLLGWAVAACSLIAGAAAYATWRDPSAAFGEFPFALAIPLALALYVAHHLIEPADEARRWRPPYPMLVDGAWRHVFQLALGLGFVGVLWGTLELGGALFDLIGITAVGRVVQDGWFTLPVLGLGFAGAVHLTDVRPAMIEGVRTVGLTLLAWILILAVGLLAAFLLALPATGLAPLWATGHSAALLLGAAALLVVLLNAAYQDGRRPDALPGAIRWAGRLAGVLLAPLTVLAGWGILLRIGQYGITPGRVFGLAVAGVAIVYACGYLWAACSRGPWMQPLERINIVAALVGLVAILLLLSPALDPLRLTAEDQARRLASGRSTTPGADLAFLAASAGRYGREALVHLAESPDATLAAAARAAIATRNGEAPKPPRPPGPAFAQAHVRSAGTDIPQGFRNQRWTFDDGGMGARCLIDDTPCDVFVGDIDGDGSTDVIVKAEGLPQLFTRAADGIWVWRGYWDDTGCSDAEAAFAAGRIRAIKPEEPDLEAGGLRLHFHENGNCRPVKP